MHKSEGASRDGAKNIVSTAHPQRVSGDGGIYGRGLGHDRHILQSPLLQSPLFVASSRLAEQQ